MFFNYVKIKKRNLIAKIPFALQDGLEPTTP